MSTATTPVKVVTYHKVIWTFDHVVFNYISTTTIPKATKPSRMLNFGEELPPIKWWRKVRWMHMISEIVRVVTYPEVLLKRSHDPLITWSCDLDFLLYSLQVQNANAYVVTDFLLILLYLLTLYYRLISQSIFIFDFLSILLVCMMVLNLSCTLNLRFT